MIRDYSTTVENQDTVYREFFERMQRSFLKTLVCEEIIEEHRKQPLGQHSEPLERLLLYFRRAPQKDRYAIRRDDSANLYRLIRLSGEKKTAEYITEEEEGYATSEEAYHEVFMRRIDELMNSDK